MLKRRGRKTPVAKMTSIMARLDNQLAQKKAMYNRRKSKLS